MCLTPRKKRYLMGVVLKQAEKKDGTMKRLSEFLDAYLLNILWSAWRLVRKSWKTPAKKSRSLDGVLSEAALHASIRTLRIPGVQSFHAVTIGRNGYSLKVSLHVATTNRSKKRIRGRVFGRLCQLGIVHPTITVCSGEGWKDCK